MYSTGNTYVDEISNIKIFGNIIHEQWYNHIKLPSGAPDIIAIILLSDIWHWYTATPERDEATGRLIGMRKKFKGNLLQKTYGSYAKQYGLNKKQISNAIIRLEKEYGLIERIFGEVEVAGATYNNVLYLKPCIDRLKAITLISTCSLPPSLSSGREGTLHREGHYMNDYMNDLEINPKPKEKEKKEVEISDISLSADPPLPYNTPSPDLSASMAEFTEPKNFGVGETPGTDGCVVSEGESMTPAQEPPLTPDTLMDLYNQLTPEDHPKILRRTQNRYDRAAKYLTLYPEAAFWSQAFGAVSRSDFLQGKKPGNSHSHFVASFEWFTVRGKDRRDNCLKAAGGKYHNHVAASPPPLQEHESIGMGQRGLIENDTSGALKTILSRFHQQVEIASKRGY